MSSVASPFGLRPVLHPSGEIRNAQATIADGYATDIYQYSPVQLDSAGQLQVAAAGNRAIGTFLGVEWTDSDGRRKVSNRWTANTTGSDIVAYYTRDQEIIYAIQADDTVGRAAIGEQYDWTTLGGNSTTGLSDVALDVATAAGAGGNAGLRVVGLYPGPDNEWDDSFPVLHVQISEHQYVADRVAI